MPAGFPKAAPKKHRRSLRNPSRKTSPGARVFQDAPIDLVPATLGHASVFITGRYLAGHAERVVIILLSGPTGTILALWGAVPIRTVPCDIQVIGAAGAHQLVTPD